MRALIYSYGLFITVVALILFLERIPFQPYLFLCGGVLTGLGLRIFYNQIAFFRSSRVTYGKLVNWKEVSGIGRNGRHKLEYYAVVAFEAADGTQHQLTSATGCSPRPRTPMGKRLPVRYSPENPEDARLDTLFDYWGPPVIILLFGVIVFAISFYAVHSR